MITRFKRATIGLVLVSLSYAGMIGSGSAVTTEVARACETAAAKAFPPRQIGNPAAGTSKGTAKERRDFFNRCAANNGKVDDGPGAAPSNAGK